MSGCFQWIYQEMVSSTQQMRTIHALSAKLKETQDQRDQALQAVGAMLYATHTGAPTASDDMVEKLTEIDGYCAKIAELEDKLRHVKAKAVCTNCGTPAMERTAFCQHCGAKL